MSFTISLFWSYALRSDIARTSLSYTQTHHLPSTLVLIYIALRLAWLVAGYAFLNLLRAPKIGETSGRRDCAMRDFPLLFIPISPGRVCVIPVSSPVSSLV
ncbi:hypothetical protein K504DRAFT_250119 [Pleomassaria siparia CBS 279.74]|uniref:Uncharacterized protein n=1 Tax=Pleomassaria siparia CBS 279.74 TaxID=1314801 RepID=A0A6G1KAW2_9PLEO|nr:hypothetical protein K504DRAFT_250119 [Pleomassaria siparia CBS 279.74]